MSQDGAHAGHRQEAGDAGHGEGGHAHGSDARGADHGGIFGERTELILAALAGAALLAGWLLASRAPSAVYLSLYAFTYVFGGFFTLKENLRRRRFEIDTLMLVAAAGAAFLGEFAEGGLLLVLFSLGHALEHLSLIHI